MRLSESSLDRLARDVARPGYDRAAQAVGLVHFGIGAFHRAHQAWYSCRAMEAGDTNWAITGISLRSDNVAQQLNPQNGLYSVTERSARGWHSRVIGSLRNVLVAPQQRAATIAALAAPTTHIASFTVTEKGYCRAPDGGLDQQLAGATSIYGYIAQGLRLRHDAGMGGLSLMSCDNLADNGRQFARLMGEYLERHDPGLRPWLDKACTFPSTMVDRIVPATTPEDRAQIAAQIGLVDDAAVMTEPFSQWVIEDRFAGPRPRWEQVGAQLVADVRPFETAKLRMLNGAHSLLAYAGLARGHSFVHQAIADPHLRTLTEQLLRDEAAPTVTPASGQDLTAYADALMARFANPALDHKLIQIAMDGSQKLPQRWLETLEQQRQRGRTCPAILSGIAAWIAHLRGDNGPVDDPRARALNQAVGQPDPGLALFGPSGVLAGFWNPQPADLQQMASLQPSTTPSF